MKPAYKCEYCDKVSSEDVIREHEEKCLYNPENKTCYTCRNAIIKNGTLYGCSMEKPQNMFSVYRKHECYEYKGD